VRRLSGKGKEPEEPETGGKMLLELASRNWL
jgi:hypothetical protein